MPEDVQMSDAGEVSRELSPHSQGEPSQRSSSPANSHVDNNDDDDASDGSDDESDSSSASHPDDQPLDSIPVDIPIDDKPLERPGDVIVIESDEDTKPPVNVPNPNPTATSSAASTSLAVPPQAAGSKPASTAAAKPKSKARAASPTPPPPVPPPPLQTIRLEIQLGGPKNYEVDIAALAKATGQRAPTPPPVKRDTSDSEGEDDAGGAQPQVKKRRRRNKGDRFYDLNDPFIDDSELAVDERQFFAQTKQQGFYVSSGEVALLKDKTPRKPKSKKAPLIPILNETNGAGPSTLPKHLASGAGKADGTRDSPIALLDDTDGEQAGMKRRRSDRVHDASSNKKRKVDISEFSPEMQSKLDALKAAIAKENWENKSKFPPALKPLLAETAIRAIELNEYGERFFMYMPVIFPYNKFTMTKLIKRTVWQDHQRILVARQTALIEELERIARESFPRAQDDWERQVVAWKNKQDKSTAPTSEPNADSRQASGDEGGSGTEHPEGEGGKNAKEKEAQGAQPPPKKYRLTDEMKVLLWRIVTLSNDCCTIENEKNTLDGTGLHVSEQGLRKVLYQKIVAAFPEGWMSSSQISREVSAMKKRLEKEQMEYENE